MRVGIPSMTCQELVELITDYWEGMLSGEERERFELHLQGCEDCRIYVNQMVQTIRIVGRLSEEHLDEPAREELLAAFRTWKQSPDQ